MKFFFSFFWVIIALMSKHVDLGYFSASSVMELL